MLDFKTKLSYGIGGICDNALYTLTSTYLLLYLTTVVGLNSTVAGFISAIGSIWEAVVAPIIGFKSDGTISRFGKRKPFLIVASIPLAVITSLLFTAINASVLFKAIYYGVLIVLFWTFFSCEFIPYLSWGADLTEDYNERTVLRSYSYIFNQVGMLIGMVLPTIVIDYVMNLGGSTKEAWSTVGIFVGVCSGVALLLSALTIKKDDKKDFVKVKNKEKVNGKVLKNMFKEYGHILKLKPLIPLILASMFYLIANTLFSSSRVFYMTYNMLKDEKFISLMMLIITISGIIFVPFISKLSNKLDKKNVFMYGIGISGILMILFRFTNPNVIIICLVYSIANTCYWQLMPSMMYDVCMVEELKDKEAKSGAVISVQALSESISIALGLQALGVILDVSGFNEGVVEQTDMALNWVSNSFTLIPGVFMIMVLVFMMFYPINKKTFAKVSSEVEKERRGEEINLEGIEKLF